MWPDPSNKALPDKEFRKHYDALLITGELNPDILVFCDRYQQRSLNDLKKALKRFAARDAVKSDH